ncbi:hypothetical protein FQN49_008652, partial [Arthroderma sp. PD_2]
MAVNFVKVPDGTFRPRRRDNAGPTLVIEVGLFERDRKLSIDAQGWLEADGFHTEVVITAKVDRRTPSITWWEDFYPADNPWVSSGPDMHGG